MLHELPYHPRSSFLTITYNDDYLPPLASLCKRDFQLFLKRLRKIAPHKIRYFACGEYGPETDRPHYHCILFGLDVRDREIIDHAWSRGVIKYGAAEPDSIRYVAQYIDDKLDGDLAVDIYDRVGRERPFRLSSLGIGRQFCDDNAEQLRQRLHLTVNGRKMSIPRYYLDRAGVDKDRVKQYALESDIDQIEELTGLSDIDRDLFYKVASPTEYMQYNDVVQRRKKQSDKNLQARKNLKRRSKI